VNADIFVLERGVRLRTRGVGGPALLSPERATLLNRTALAALELLDGTRSVAEIAARLAELHHADHARVEADLATLMRELVLLHLVKRRGTAPGEGAP
jgi:coenzyme PQQ biosynthesis protein PqqD